MGGGGSSARRVTFEADEHENITVVKGVRVRERPGTRGTRPQPLEGPRGQINEEELKKRITEELALEQARRETEAQKRLKQDQKYIRDEIGKVLERERAASNEHLTRAILRERAATEDERLKTQHFVSAISFYVNLKV
uniref:MIC19 protein n=1 Tax=Gopherus agassizii TaxID=38772 RepID=A0A452GQZ8_9SAUR